MKVKEYRVMWFQASACSGCTVSVLNTLTPNIRDLLINPVIPGKHLSLVFQLTIMAGSGEMVLDHAKIIAGLADAPDPSFPECGKWSSLRQPEPSHRKPEIEKEDYILVIEGAIPFKDNGLFCTMGQDEEGKAVPILNTLEAFARNASKIIALGTCAAFGGIPAADPNPGNCQSVNHFLSGTSVAIDTPFINLSGCPCHPDWFTGTVVDIMNGSEIELDEYSRPLAFYKDLIHHECPRYPNYMEDVYAKHLGDDGCFKELGCKGRVTYADCPTRKWNSGTSWCIEAGTPCIGCAHPGFPDIEIVEIE